jgi:hypothetical protein
MQRRLRGNFVLSTYGGALAWQAGFLPRISCEQQEMRFLRRSLLAGAFKSDSRKDPRNMEGSNVIEAKRCIYCRDEKLLGEFSEEHIVPQFMGGSSECTAAVTHDVCRQCNGIFGRFVDAAVAKGFFMNANEGGAWKACVDFDEVGGNVFPLIYFGKCTEIQCVQGEEVEVWLGPDGGTAWHFHEDRDENFETFAGGDPMLRRKAQSSRAYVFQASSAQYWLLSNLKSAAAHFKEEPIFIGADSDIEGQLPEQRSKGTFSRKDAAAIVERDRIRQLLDRRTQIQHLLKLDTLFDVRFLAKLAVAFGHKIFGEDYGGLGYTSPPDIPR